MTDDTAIRQALWSCIDALGVRGQVSPTAPLVDLVQRIEEEDLSLTEALVLGVFITNAAEQQMTLAVEASTAVDRHLDAYADGQSASAPELAPPAEPKDRADLVGRTVAAVHLGGAYDNDTTLYLECVEDEGVLVLDTQGDCCSMTWWNDVMQIKQLIGAKVTAIEDIEMPEPEQTDKYEYLQDYGIKITTDRGVCTLVYRNSSNGYYGGSSSARWQHGVPEKARQLTEDHSA